MADDEELFSAARAQPSATLSRALEYAAAVFATVRSASTASPAQPPVTPLQHPSMTGAPPSPMTLPPSVVQHRHHQHHLEEGLRVQASHHHLLTHHRPHEHLEDGLLRSFHPRVQWLERVFPTPPPAFLSAEWVEAPESAGAVPPLQEPLSLQLLAVQHLLLEMHALVVEVRREHAHKDGSERYFARAASRRHAELLQREGAVEAREAAATARELAAEGAEHSGGVRGSHAGVFTHPDVFAHPGIAEERTLRQSADRRFVREREARRAARIRHQHVMAVTHAQHAVALAAAKVTTRERDDADAFFLSRRDTSNTTPLTSFRRTTPRGLATRPRSVATAVRVAAAAASPGTVAPPTLTVADDETHMLHLHPQEEASPIHSPESAGERYLHTIAGLLVTSAREGRGIEGVSHALEASSHDGNEEDSQHGEDGSGVRSPPTCIQSSRVSIVSGSAAASIIMSPIRSAQHGSFPLRSEHREWLREGAEGGDDDESIVVIQREEALHPPPP